MCKDIDFEEFVNRYGEEIDIELSENGADREMDFSRHNEYMVRYGKYVDKYMMYDESMTDEVKKVCCIEDINGWIEEFS